MPVWGTTPQSECGHSEGACIQKTRRKQTGGRELQEKARGPSGPGHLRSSRIQRGSTSFHQKRTRSRRERSGESDAATAGGEEVSEVKGEQRVRGPGLSREGLRKPGSEIGNRCKTFPRKVLGAAPKGRQDGGFLPMSLQGRTPSGSQAQSPQQRSAQNRTLPPTLVGRNTQLLCWKISSQHDSRIKQKTTQGAAS